MTDGSDLAVQRDDLREQEEQYRSIFEATSDAMAIVNMDGYIVEANSATCALHGYEYDELVGLHVSALTHPDYQDTIDPGIEDIATGGSAPQRLLGVRKDGSTFLEETRGTSFVYRGMPHILAMARDITERVRAEERLREKEEQYRRTFEATSDAMLIVDADNLVVEANQAAVQMWGRAKDKMIGQTASVLHSEVLRDLRSKGTYVGRALNMREDGTTFHLEGRVTPFTYGDKPHFLVTARDVTEEVEARALLETRVLERTRELSTLLEVSRNVASTLELDDLLDLILDQIKTVVDYTGASVMAMEGAELILLQRRAPNDEGPNIRHRFLKQGDEYFWERITQGETVIIPDVWGDTPDAIGYRDVNGELMHTYLSYVRSWMAVPMVLKDRVIGLLTLASAELGTYTEHHASLALAIARQAAIAIENAQLYRKAQEAAVLEERQRLARELHDSVTQALFGITLGTQTARTLLERDPAEAREALDYVYSLGRAGMAEMRALIFELRPESLELEGLVVALEKQAAALSARFEIAVDTAFCQEPDVPLRAKEILYRVSQEALHNIVKHAEATEVRVSLLCSEKEILLQIGDNGRGFDPGGEFPGHLGLRSMRERVSAQGGTLQIQSGAGGGTRITARLPLP